MPQKSQLVSRALGRSDRGMYVCSMSWELTRGQQTEFCSCKLSWSKLYPKQTNSS